MTIDRRDPIPEVDDRDVLDGDGPPPVVQPRLGPIGWLRFGWRQLTSMRTALTLLMLLALAAIPGSVFPQNRIDPVRVQAYIDEHARTAPLLKRLGAFDVYTSPWFSAVYLLLFVSLIGCVLPRARQHWRNLRATPPRAPRNLDRMPAHLRAESDDDPDAVLAAARVVLAKRRYRLAPAPAGDDAVAAEKGHWAETGNLAFHLALLWVLVGIAAGSFLSYTGQATVVVGQSWADTLLSYDQFTPGRAVDPDALPPFSVTLDAMRVRFDTTAGSQLGAARQFDADVTYTAEPGGKRERRTISPNHPLEVDGASAYLVGNGYAPVLTVRDAEGRIVADQPTPFQPVDGNYTSNGVVKVPDGLRQQVGIVGLLLPTAATTTSGRQFSVFPGATNPKLLFTAFAGDLGIDDGVPQSVYSIDASRMKQLTVGGKQFSASLGPGQTVDLPDGLGSVTFSGLRRYAALQVRADPTKLWVLGGAALALAGLTLSLFVHRRRVWVRAGRDARGRTVVEVAGLSRSEDAGLEAEVAALLEALPAGPAGDGANDKEPG